MLELAEVLVLPIRALARLNQQNQGTWVVAQAQGGKTGGGGWLHKSAGALGGRLRNWLLNFTKGPRMRLSVEYEKYKQHFSESPLAPPCFLLQFGLDVS